MSRKSQCTHKTYIHRVDISLWVHTYLFTCIVFMTIYIHKVRNTCMYTAKLQKIFQSQWDMRGIMLQQLTVFMAKSFAMFWRSSTNIGQAECRHALNRLLNKEISTVKQRTHNLQNAFQQQLTLTRNIQCGNTVFQIPSVTHRYPHPIVGAWKVYRRENIANMLLVPLFLHSNVHLSAQWGYNVCLRRCSITVMHSSRQLSFLNL